MARSELAGWSSTEQHSPNGAVRLEQRVRVASPLVDASEAGARSLGDRYWREVESFTRGLVRVRPRGREIELCLLGRLPLLRFGEPRTSVGDSVVSSTFPIVGGLLSRGPAGSITFAQTSGPAIDVRATVEDFLPRLAGRHGGPAWTRALYVHVQQRFHTAISRRYFRRLIGEAKR